MMKKAEVLKIIKKNLIEEIGDVFKERKAQKIVDSICVELVSLEIQDLKIENIRPVSSSSGSDGKSYYVFSKYPYDDKWYYYGEYNTKEKAEEDMVQETNEPEVIQYMVIKGNELDTYEGIARHPRYIQE